MFGLSRFEWLVLGAAVLLLPTLALGADREDASAGASTPSAASLFQRLDRNRDGYLNADELASDEAKRGNWIAVDRDRDGRISRTEFGTVGASASAAEPSAATGATRPPKPE